LNISSAASVLFFAFSERIIGFLPLTNSTFSVGLNGHGNSFARLAIRVRHGIGLRKAL
jgi:hypothetical protein